jgi:hypothetical protein
VNVYRECLPNGGGGGGHSAGGPASVANSTAESGLAAEALRNAGKDRRALQAVERTGPSHRLRPPSGGATGASTDAVGSAFDLGSGPTALLVALAATALLLLGGSGLRLWRRSHRA